MTRWKDQVLAYTLHADGQEFRLVLQPDGGAAPRWVSSPLALRSISREQRVELTPADAERLPLTAPLQAALPLPELIKHRDALSKLVLVLPDKTELHYLGLREFGPVKPQWTASADGSLTRTADGHRLQAQPRHRLLRDRRERDPTARFQGLHRRGQLRPHAVRRRVPRPLPVHLHVDGGVSRR